MKNAKGVTRDEIADWMERDASLEELRLLWRAALLLWALRMKGAAQ